MPYHDVAIACGRPRNALHVRRSFTLSMLSITTLSNEVSWFFVTRATSILVRPFSTLQSPLVFLAQRLYACFCPPRGFRNTCSGGAMGLDIAQNGQVWEGIWRTYVF